ncbi:uncharacterized protein LOC106667031 [Cimex lectularius]|uniref:Kynurenine formamidase n=1 Tax=Cimex lectularius TaxID=79782 RepID=A0A8I6RR83_CIMLE|nr:uncharacterized protein LOC106667031 [Cimex lectularius]
MPPDMTMCSSTAEIIWVLRILSFCIMMLTILNLFALTQAQPFKGCSSKNYVDLGHVVDENTIEFPGGAKFRYTSQFAGPDPNGVWYSSNDFKTAEHAGTHFDAPYHFDKNGRKVADIPLTKLITKAVFVNASAETSGNYKYKLPASKLTEWEKANGPMPSNSVVIVGFGWSHKYPNRKEYLGPSDDDLRFPGLSLEAAQWIVDSGKVVGVGVDTASADQGSNTDVHVSLMKNDIYILENVNLNHPSLPPTFDVIVMPMMLNNGTGAPTRIIAALN